MGQNFRREHGVLAALVTSSLVIHYFTRIRGFGEPDEARIGIFALTWREAGVFSTDTYLNRTSPLYLLFTRFLLDHGPPSGLADALNVANVVVGALALIPMYVLFRSVARDPLAAFLGVVTYALAPTFFYGNAYGMPHIPALACLLTSLACFAHALGREGPPNVTFLALSTLAMAGAAGMKSDVILCGLAFPALVPLVGPTTRVRLGAALAVPALGLAAALALTRLALPVPVSNVEFGAQWSKQFPFDPRWLVESSQLRVVARALGPVLWVAAGAALALSVARRERPAEDSERARKLVLFTLAWALPALIFWGMIQGHSLRHLTAALCPVALLVAVGVRSLTKSALQATLALGLLLLVNYFWLSPTRHAQAGTPRLFATLAGIQAESDRLSANGQRFANDPAPHKLLVGGVGVPTCEYALLERGAHFVRTILIPGVAWDLALGERERERARPMRVNVRSGIDAPPPGFATEGVVVWHAERGALH